jgi:hypothetical protein
LTGITDTAVVVVEPLLTEPLVGLRARAKSAMGPAATTTITAVDIDVR